MPSFVYVKVENCRSIIEDSAPLGLQGGCPDLSEHHLHLHGANRTVCVPEGAVHTAARKPIRTVLRTLYLRA